jgi:thioredoxin-like negative regulator of GroEL
MAERRIVLLAALLLLVLGARLDFSRAWAGLLEDQARQSMKPLIARFGLDRCLQCIRQKQVFEEVAPRFQGELLFRFVHIDREANLAAAHKILLVPTVLFFDVRGNEVFRHVGLHEAEDLLAKFREQGWFPGGPGG